MAQKRSYFEHGETDKQITFLLFFQATTATPQSNPVLPRKLGIQGGGGGGNPVFWYFQQLQGYAANDKTNYKQTINQNSKL